MSVMSLKTMKKFHQSRSTWETIPSWKLSEKENSSIDVNGRK